MSHNLPGRQRGAALVVGLIMLVLITIMLLSAVVLSTSNFRSVSNMQFREEAIAAANRALDDVISSPFMNAPQAELINVDIDSDGDTDYVVQIDTPVCISATEAFGADPSSLSLPPAMTVDSTWNTVWDIRATVAADESVATVDADGNPVVDVDGNPVMEWLGNAGGAAVVVRAGVRALLSEAQKETVCT